MAAVIYSSLVFRYTQAKLSSFRRHTFAFVLPILTGRMYILNLRVKAQFTQYSYTHSKICVQLYAVPDTIGKVKHFLFCCRNQPNDDKQ